MKKYTIYYTNSKDEVVKFHIKNMPDSDERGMIAYLEKIKRYIQDISYFILGCSMIVCLFWTLKHKDDISVCFCILGLLLLACILKVALENILEEHFIKRNGCEFLLQYLDNCSDRNWTLLKDKTYGILSLLEARTPEGTLFLADPQKQAAAVRIVFYETSFKINWVSYAESGDQIQKNYLFNIEHVIKNCKLEKDAVEYDVMKNELRVPLEFDFLRSELKVPMSFDYDH